MPTAEFCKKIMSNPRAFGKATKWEDMSPKERGIHIARIKRDEKLYGDE